MKRRDMMKALLGLSTAALFAPLSALAQSARNMVKITAVKAMQLREGRTLIKIETDAGVSGYGECGANGPVARAIIAAHNGGARLPHLSLIGKDPLAIQVHFHNMFYAYEQRQRQIRVFSGIDMALWDLAGQILKQPVSVLLGGPYRTEIDLYSHCPGGDYLDKKQWRDRVAELKADPGGFRAFKIDTHHVLGVAMQEYTPSLGPQELRRMETAYRLAREAFGDDIDILVHCHCEFDVPSSIGIAHAVEGIRPLYLEDPLAPAWSEGWNALRRATRVPIMTGENMELAEWAIPFLANQAVDIFQPDIINSGGISGTKMIADLAGSYRIPVALHNVSGLMLNVASQQLAAAIFNCPRIECSRTAANIKWANPNPLAIRNGRMHVSDRPGLGVELDQDFLRANLAPGESWWG